MGLQTYYDFKSQFGGTCMQCAGGASAYIRYVTGKAVDGHGKNFCKGWGGPNTGCDALVPTYGKYVTNGRWKDGDIGAWTDQKGSAAQGCISSGCYGHVAMYDGGFWWGFNQGCGDNCDRNVEGGTACSIYIGAPYSVFRLKKVGGGGIDKIVINDNFRITSVVIDGVEQVK